MMSDMAKVLSVNVTAIVHEGEWTGRVGRTGIDKRPILGRITMENNAVEGDVVTDRKSHGGYDKAVYAYAREDAQWWERELGVSIDSGRFGENLTTQGVDLSGAVTGERWRIGTSVATMFADRTEGRSD